MGSYKNGDGTRSLILDTCRSLFYEIGYEETTFDIISAQSGVNRGLIHYHFKKKSEIRKEIAIQSIKNDRILARKYIGNYGSLPACEYIFWYKFIKDEHYRNFFISSFFGGDWDTESDFKDLDDLAFSTGIGLDYINQHFHLEYTLVESMNSVLCTMVNRDPDRYRFDELTEKIYYITCKLFELPEEEIQRKLTMLRQCKATIPFEELKTTL